MLVKLTLIVVVTVSRKDSNAALLWSVLQILIASVKLADRIILVFVSIFFRKAINQFNLCFLLADQCSDGFKDLNETDIDCGGACVENDKRCNLTKVCLEDNDCINGACGQNNTCVCEYLI